MIRAGIREARRNLSVLLDEVRKGEEVIITDRGRPVATLSRFDPSRLGKPLPDRRRKIRKRSRITADSAAYVSEMRDRP
jgi:antitoxin (DNA-binding transcriptional repressor) of toxin-antitoxin stability system